MRSRVFVVGDSKGGKSANSSVFWIEKIQCGVTEARGLNLRFASESSNKDDTTRGILCGLYLMHGILVSLVLKRLASAIQIV